MPIRIQPITIQLIEAYRAVLDAVARERKYLSRESAPPIEQTRTFVLGNIEAGNPHLLAMDGEAVVGWCDVRRNSDFNTRHSGTLGMGCLPVYRNRGIGQALLGETIAAARRIGLTRIELSVYASNHAAIRLYEKMGFVKEGIRRNAIFHDGAYDDTFIMAIVDCTQ
ncbi:GNAT family N-acetyltransferase [Rhizobium sp. P32RR-XVIII]|uniref:GNAT family N-acetyltransferase n=1 Tax=Rhizobium sp. P32RR-XVIII TaxID=2726738 RepID=UPI00145745B7|nr:GNAT family N-acetyltransferase [Rhizobium sp. P32RR-XVIII]NLS04394.1 GNAT family N-acetyltransferase [Rhizobium sp. P32RR-XVIII]